VRGEERRDQRREVAAPERERRGDPQQPRGAPWRLATARSASSASCAIRAQRA
jgi:hypothetical protein